MNQSLFHLFTPGPNRDTRFLVSSNLASERLRMAPASKAARSLGHKVTTGDRQQGHSDYVLVGKPGGADILKRSDIWLGQLQALRSRGAKIFLDYTDHHLETNSSMTEFYKEAVELCSAIFTPSKELANTLKLVVPGKKITVIEDVLDTPVATPQRPDCGSSRAGIWFGHSSNISFLAEFLNQNSVAFAGHELFVVSDPHGLLALKRFPFNAPPKLKVNFIEWTINKVVDLAGIADYCLIPSDQNSPKRFASSNRLITALALGLPTIATPIFSYQEFSDYFLTTDSDDIPKLITNPQLYWPKILKFQETLISRFGASSITNNWLNAFSSV